MTTMVEHDFDLTSLGITAEPEAVEPEAYVAPYSTEQLPIDAGTYTANLIAGTFKSGGAINTTGATSKKNGKTYLAVEFQVRVNNATIKGKDVGQRNLFCRVDCIPESLKFTDVKKGREFANGFMDMLIAAGYKGSLVSNDDYLNALLGLIEDNASIRVRVDWNAFSNPKSQDYDGTGETLRGAKNFPIGDDGQPDPHATFGSGDNEHTVLARAEVRAFYPARK